MRMVFCVFRYFPYGGLQKDMRRIAEAAVAAGHSVHIVCGSWEGEKPDGIPVSVLPVEAYSNHRRDALLAQKLLQAARSLKPHLVVGFNRMPGLDVYYAADSCFAAKVFEDRLPGLRFLPRYRHHLAMEKAVFGSDSRTDILMISPPQVPVFQQYYQTPDARLHLLPPGISRDRVANGDALLRRATMRRQWDVAEHEKVILVVGSGFRTKGLDRAIQALANLPEGIRRTTRLWVVGQDDARAFERQASRLNVAEHVRFFGGRPDVPEFLLAADVLLHPAYRENTGTVLLEAMVSGLPVVTTAVCGYAPYVREHNLGVVLEEPFRQAALDEALLKQLSGPSRGILLERGRAFAANADIFSLPERAVETLEEVATQRYGTLP
ncbi:MAG: glycosyltransferase [Gammaproteobacteria bacterium]|nr:MAG: glycosyltransferase [Gammaproteobacteria bacterium]